MAGAIRFVRPRLPLRTRRNVYILILVSFIISTYLLSINEIGSLDRTLREEFGVDEIEPEGYELMDFPQSRADFVESDLNHLGQDVVKSFAWFNPPRWLRQKTSAHMFSKCHHKKKCRISYDASEISQADAVVFHGDRLSNFTPPVRGNNQVYVYFLMEPPPYATVTSEWRYIFNWTVSYRRDSDIWRPYGELRPNRTKLPKDYFQKVLQKKTKGVAWVVSRCISQSQREKYVEELQKYIDVDIYGRCGKNACGKTCFDDLEVYRFFLAFENSMCSDYVTEKFFNTFKHDFVPVVRGGADYPSLFGDVLINTADFNSIQELGEYLNSLLKNDEEYIKFLKNKHKHYVAFPVPWCDLCERLHRVEKYRKTIDIQAWLDEGKCKKPTDIH